MKQFKVIHQGKEFHIFANDALSAVSKLADERLAPTTYRKLRELGYSENSWKDMTQKEANALIEKHLGESKKLSALTPLKSVKASDYEELSSLRDLIYHRRLQPVLYSDAEADYLKHGREINERIRSGHATGQDKQIIKELQKGMAPIDKNIKLYRTNTVETIIDGGGLENSPIMSCTCVKQLIIPENKNKVRENLEFLVDRGTNIRVVNNAEEAEVLLNGENVAYDVLDEWEEDGVLYKQIHISNKRK